MKVPLAGSALPLSAHPTRHVRESAILIFCSIRLQQAIACWEIFCLRDEGAVVHRPRRRQDQSPIRWFERGGGTHSPPSQNHLMGLVLPTPLLQRVLEDALEEDRRSRQRALRAKLEHRRAHKLAVAETPELRQQVFSCVCPRPRSLPLCFPPASLDTMGYDMQCRDSAAIVIFGGKTRKASCENYW